MTRRQTRLFFVIGTTVFAVIFIALTIDSHTKFGELTNEQNLTEEVIAGKHVWHRKNCINCHTLLGEGAYFAPDLTKITQQRGEAYLRAFLQDPSRFYSEEMHGRLMPNPNLSDEQITQVIAFLDWVANIDNQDWPPRPIVVTAATPPGIVLGTPPTAAGLGRAGRAGSGDLQPYAACLFQLP
jgi:nitric oxide reductase subunit C